MAKVKQEVLDYSDMVVKAGACDGKSGAITSDSLEIYNNNLPAGITPEIVKSLSDYDAIAIPGMVHAAGVLAIEAMSKSPDLTRCEGELPFGHKNSVTVIVDRSKTYQNHLTGKGEEIVRHGVVSPIIHYRTGNSGGQMQAARQEVANLAAASLTKK